MNEIDNDQKPVDVVQSNINDINNAQGRKGITMNLKTLFVLGMGTVLLVCGIIALIIVLIGKKYTVTFETDGGSKIASVTVKKGKTVEKPKDPTKEDYTFVEWQLNGKTYDFDSKVTKDIKLKAVWEIELTEDIYTITFETYGGSEIESQSVHGNGKVLKPSDPTREHSRFVEWQLDGEKYDFESLVKKDITLEATWTSMPSHDVTFDYDGGGDNYSQVVYEGDTIDKPKDPEKEGYKFKEWQKEGKKYDFNTPVIADITLKAKYEEAKQYTVTFDNDGVTTQQKVYEGSKVSKPTDPTKNNYSFGGWQLDGQAYDFNTKITKDITLKAKWDEVKICNVTLDNFNIAGRTRNIKIKCGTKLSKNQAIEAVKNDCMNDYNRADICNKLDFHYCDMQRDYIKEEVFDFNTIINEDINLAYFIGYGAAD